MKRLIFIALSAMFCFGTAAQNDVSVSEPSEAISGEMTNDALISQNSMFGMVQEFSPIGQGVVKVEEQVYPLGNGLFKKHHIEQALEICPSVSKSKVSQSELLTGEHIDEANDTGYGLNFGYSVVFIPGYEKDNKLHLNKAGFAYRVGFDVSFTQSDRYGTLCDFLAKAGLETCYNRNMGIGVDFLAGYGKSGGDLFIYKNITEDDEPSSVIPYALWGTRFGGQIWVKTGFLGNTSSNADVLLFARLLKAIYPEKINEFSVYHHNLWREENWSFGVMFRYRM